MTSTSKVWDLYNEPDNPNKSAYGPRELPDRARQSLMLLKKVFTWAREVNPSQPLTCGVWIGNWPDPEKLSPMEQLQIDQSDVISYHCYGPLDEMKKCIEHLGRYKRPLLCTEYMARPQNSTFDPILGYLRNAQWPPITGASWTAKARPFTRGIHGTRRTPPTQGVVP